MSKSQFYHEATIFVRFFHVQIVATAAKIPLGLTVGYTSCYHGFVVPYKLHIQCLRRTTTSAHEYSIQSDNF